MRKECAIWVDPHGAADQYEWLREPARLLREGGIVAFPTETVYGLGANAEDESAVLSVFRAKGRPSDNPLIVHLANAADLTRVTTLRALPPTLLRLATAFWPGPLTLLLPARDTLAASVHPGTDTVGVLRP